MVVKSRYPDLDLPVVDIFSFLFKRKDRKFPDSHGMSHTQKAVGLAWLSLTLTDVAQQRSSVMALPTRRTASAMSKSLQNNSAKA